MEAAFCPPSLPRPRRCPRQQSARSRATESDAESGQEGQPGEPQRAGSWRGHALRRETRRPGAGVQGGRGEGGRLRGPRPAWVGPADLVGHARRTARSLRAPLASGGRVNAPVVTTGPGSESRGAESVGCAAGAPGGRSGRAGDAADGRARLSLPCRGRSAPPRAPGFPTCGQQVVPVDRERVRLCCAESGSCVRQLGPGGGRSVDAPTRVANGIGTQGRALRSGLGRRLNPSFLVQRLPELLGELSRADAGCLAPRRNTYRCFLVWTQAPVQELEMGNGLSDQTSILSSLPSFQSFHIVILGLDCAGKTTVLYRLQFNEFVNTVPTKGFNTEKIKVTLGNSKTVTFHFWDVGGQEKLRPLWKSYTRCTDGIVFVVDSVDVERMEEAKTELHKITRISENQGVPVLIVANKQDLRNSLSLTEIEKLLAMGELSSSTPWHLQPTCAIIGDGLKEGLEKLHDMIIKRRKMLRQQKKKR
ncbi:ADP-ribosylation factor-like protein 4A [Galemys pyrenaicus]|nr:ADP-ribosylation factor-like protein 4A [Galemys pyrenaicus]